MKQQTLAVAASQSGYEQYGKPARRDEFLATMQVIVPWKAQYEVIEPHYPKAGNGRSPIGLERMLHIHFIQHWFNLADLACEEALYGSASLHRFVGLIWAVSLCSMPPRCSSCAASSITTSSVRPCLQR